jgi:hypothetical protein
MKSRQFALTPSVGQGATRALLMWLDSGTVSNTAPAGPGSLRQSIIDTNANPGHDTVDFGVSGPDGTVEMWDATDLLTPPATYS